MSISQVNDGKPNSYGVVLQNINNKESQSMIEIPVGTTFYTQHQGFVVNSDGVYQEQHDGSLKKFDAPISLGENEYHAFKALASDKNLDINDFKRGQKSFENAFKKEFENAFNRNELNASIELDMKGVFNIEIKNTSGAGLPDLLHVELPQDNTD